MLTEKRSLNNLLSQTALLLPFLTALFILEGVFGTEFIFYKLQELYDLCDINMNNLRFNLVSLINLYLSNKLDY